MAKEQVWQLGYKENDWEATDEKKKTDTIYQCRK